MGLQPELFFGVEELKTDESCPYFLQERDVVYLVPVFLAFVREENFIDLVEVSQIQSHCVCAALFIATVELAKLLTPSLLFRVECSDWLTCEGILHLAVVVYLPGLCVFSK